MTDLARRVVDVCRQIAGFSESPGGQRELFFRRRCVKYIECSAIGCARWVCAYGSTPPGIFAASPAGDGPRLIIGSHLDTVPDAGAFDGILGVVLGIALVEERWGTARETRSVSIEVIGFSEEEGVRFGVPFIGSRAVTGTLDDSTVSRGIGAAIALLVSIRRISTRPAWTATWPDSLNFTSNKGPSSTIWDFVSGLSKESRPSRMRVDISRSGQPRRHNADGPAARRPGGGGGVDLARRISGFTGSRTESDSGGGRSRAERHQRDRRKGSRQSRRASLVRRPPHRAGGALLDAARKSANGVRSASNSKTASINLQRPWIGT